MRNGDIRACIEGQIRINGAVLVTANILDFRINGNILCCRDRHIAVFKSGEDAIDVQTGIARTNVKSTTLGNTGTTGIIDTETFGLDQPSAGIAECSGNISPGTYGHISASRGFNRATVATSRTTFSLKRDSRSNACGRAASNLDRATVAIRTTSIGCQGAAIAKGNSFCSIHGNGTAIGFT